jgi:hypothetical protein
MAWDPRAALTHKTGEAGKMRFSRFSICVDPTMEVGLIVVLRL